MVKKIAMVLRIKMIQRRYKGFLTSPREGIAKGELATRVNLRVSPTFFRCCPLSSRGFLSALIYRDYHCKDAREREKVRPAILCENSPRFSHFPRETSTPLWREHLIRHNYFSLFFPRRNKNFTTRCWVDFRHKRRNENDALLHRRRKRCIKNLIRQQHFVTNGNDKSYLGNQIFLLMNLYWWETLGLVPEAWLYSD